MLLNIPVVREKHDKKALSASFTPQNCDMILPLFSESEKEEWSRFTDLKVLLSYFFHLTSLTVIIKYIYNRGTKAEDPQAPLPSLSKRAGNQFPRMVSKMCRVSLLWEFILSSHFQPKIISSQNYSAVFHCMFYHLPNELFCLLVFILRCRQKGVITLRESFCNAERIKILVFAHMMCSSFPLNSWWSFFPVHQLNFADIDGQNMCAVFLVEPLQCFLSRQR